MTQKARPLADDSGAVTGWTPTPVSPVINELTPLDDTWVTTGSNPQGNTFRVKMGPLAKPNGPLQVCLHLRKTGTDSVPVIVTLLQGDGSVIAVRKFTNLGSSFAPLVPDFVLTDSEQNAISNYNDLHVQVFAGPVAGNLCCPNGTSPILYVSFSAGTSQCGCIDGLSVPVYFTGNPYNPATLGVGNWDGVAATGCNGYSSLHVRFSIQDGCIYHVDFYCDNKASSVFAPDIAPCSFGNDPEPLDFCSPMNYSTSNVNFVGDCSCCNATGISIVVTE